MTAEGESPALLEVRCLGGLAVRVRGAPVAGFPYDKVRSLLALLAVEPGDHPRSHVAARLWPESSEVEARRNLRHALHALRQALGPAADCLHTDRERLALQGGSPDLFVDARLLEGAAELLPHFDAGDAAQRERLGRALAAYQGPLLDGVELPGLAEWRAGHEALLRETARQVARLLTPAEEAAGEMAAALVAAGRWVELAAGEEAGHYHLVRLLREAGERKAARDQLANAEQALSAAGEGLSQRLAELGPGPAPFSAPAPQGERRSAQVLYAWLADTHAAEEPEQREVRLRRLATILQRQGAYVVPDAAGGLLGYFGYPVAREEGARQAVVAGRQLVASPEDGVRVGIEAGPILTRPDSPYPDAGGGTTRSAVELARRAGPGEVVVGAGLRERTGNYFTYQPLSEAVDTQGAAYQVTGATEASHRYPAHPRPGRGELVGRDAELEILQGHWRAAASGRGRVVGVSGEAGIGKTRLVQALMESVGQADATVREARCQPEARHRPYFPVAGLVRRVLGVAGDTPVVEQRQRIRQHLAAWESPPDGVEAALALLFGLRYPDPETDGEPPETQRRRVEAVLVALLEGLAAACPVLLVVEDFHWSDPSTAALLETVRDRIGDLPVLLLVTTRRAEDLPEGCTAYLELPPLFRQAARRVALNAAPAELAPAQLWRVVDQGAGVPLFLEELARVVAGEGSQEGGVPTTLHDLLLARLDSLGEGKRVAQVGALVGQLLDTRLLAAVLGEAEDGVASALAALTEAGVLEPCPEAGTSYYRFRHALVREAAAGSVTAEQRRYWHARIANVQLDPDGPGGGLEAGEAAEHLAAGGHPDEAAARFQEAGERALVEAALGEAERLFERGLAELARVPAGPSRDSREVDLRIGQGTVQMARLGYGATAVSDNFRRALELVVPGERSERVFRALWGLWLGSSSREGYGESRALAQRMVTLAEEIADDRLCLAARTALGNTLLWLGEPQAAREQQEVARGLCPEVAPAGLISQFGEDSRATNLAYLSWTEWYLGREAEADAAATAAREAAWRSGQPHTWAHVRTFEAMLAFFREDPAAGLPLAAEVRAVAQREGLSLWQAAGTALLGWARAGTGDPGGVDQVRRTLDLMHQAMEGVGTVFRLLLAWSQVDQGLPDGALVTLDATEQAMATTGDAFLAPEVERLRGDAYWRRDEPEAARICWQSARERARELGSPVLAARADARLVAGHAGTG